MGLSLKPAQADPQVQKRVLRVFSPKLKLKFRSRFWVSAFSKLEHSDLAHPGTKEKETQDTNKPPAITANNI